MFGDRFVFSDLTMSDPLSGTTNLRPQRCKFQIWPMSQQVESPNRKCQGLSCGIQFFLFHWGSEMVTHWIPIWPLQNGWLIFHILLIFPLDHFRSMNFFFFNPRSVCRCKIPRCATIFTARHPRWPWSGQLAAWCSGAGERSNYGVFSMMGFNGSNIAIGGSCLINIDNADIHHILYI